MTVVEMKLYHAQELAIQAVGEKPYVFIESQPPNIDPEVVAYTIHVGGGAIRDLSSNAKVFTDLCDLARLLRSLADRIEDPALEYGDVH